ncbi:MAG: 3-deoxy-manno-octulosonate cytidylyltransferase [Rickettsiales bacterium]
MNQIILIPARLASARLPDKPLADIAGVPMIVRVAERATKSGVGDVWVACDGEKIKHAVEAAGYKAVITDPDLPSGSDRIFAALGEIDAEKKYDVVINVQGDMPILDPDIIKHAVALLENPDVDIATLAAVVTSEEEKNDPAVVKAIFDEQGRATSFSRRPDESQDTHYHHIGIYAYRRAALEKFIGLPQSESEKREKLEQLRAMDAGMRIDVAVVDTVPLGVDTKETLEKARQVLASD